MRNREVVGNNRTKVKQTKRCQRWKLLATPVLDIQMDGERICLAKRLEGGTISRLGSWVDALNREHKEQSEVKRIQIRDKLRWSRTQNRGVRRSLGGYGAGRLSSG